MKIFFCFIVVISTGALLAAVDMRNPFIGIGVCAFVWGVFALTWMSKRKKVNYKKEQEALFLQWMRGQEDKRSY